MSSFIKRENGKNDSISKGSLGGVEGRASTQGEKKMLFLARAALMIMEVVSLD